MAKTSHGGSVVSGFKRSRRLEKVQHPFPFVHKSDVDMYSVWLLASQVVFCLAADQSSSILFRFGISLHSVASLCITYF